MALTHAELAIRLMTIGVLLPLVLIMVRAWRKVQAARFGALLGLAVIGYLTISSQTLRPPPGSMSALAELLAISAPYLIWAFGHALFEDTHPMQRRVLALFSLVILTDWIVGLAFPGCTVAWVCAVHIGNRVAGLGAVGHAIWIAAVGRRDDLMERRRRFRPLFVILIAAQSLSILLVETFLGHREGGVLLNLVNVSAIALLTIAFAVIFLGLRADLVPVPSSDVPRNADALPAADRPLHRALIAHMEAGGYRETGLTISILADTLGVPEHRLRKLVNRHLGFRNFSTFLNSYRLAEAKALLADEAQARLPILTIAMDLGYGSLGPFNRAFKETTGMTPSEFRQRNLR